MTRFLHWLVALMVIATIPIGTIMVMEGLPRPRQDLLFILHKNGGVIILLLVILRLVWRATRKAPPFPASLPAWQAAVAVVVHWALYALLLVMTISGYVRVSAGGFPIEMLDALGVPRLVPRSDDVAEIAKAIHFYTRYLVILLVLLHTAAALKHLFQRDGIFGRIWPPLGGRG